MLSALALRGASATVAAVAAVNMSPVAKSVKLTLTG